MQEQLPFPRRRLARTAGASVATVAAVFVALLALEGLQGLVGFPIPPFLFFYGVVVFAALLAGPWEGLLATAASSLVASMWVLPGGEVPGRIAPKDGFRLVFFVAVGLTTAGVAAYLKRMRAQVLEKERQLAAAASAQQFAAFFNNPVIGAVQLAPDSSILAVNECYCRITGYEREELLRMKIGELSVPEDRESDRLSLAPFLRGERPSFRIEKRYRRKDGRIVWVEVAASAVTDAKGQVLGTMGVVQDVSDRKRAEEALRASEERLRAHLDNSPLAIVEFGPDFRIIGWSQQAERLFGWSSGEVIGKAVSELRWIHEDDAASVAEESRGFVTGERPRSLHQNRNYRKDGSVVHCEWYNSAVYGADGKLVSVFSQVLDVTERKHADEALREAKARLEEADRRKNHFLAVLSHELRNPLAPIKNSLFILQRAAPGGEQARRAEAVIGRQVNHLARLVDDLLDVTRISRDKLKLQRARLELNELVLRAVDDNRSLFDAAGQRLEVEAAPTRVFIDADANRIAQVIGNLLQNAAKFTPSAGRITVRIEADRPSGFAVVRVADTGVGIPAHLLGSLFEPFMQADDSLDRSKGGLGLGLALVKGLVEQHGGTAEARSAGIGRGSEFTIRLPLAPIDSVADARAGEIALAGRRKVLVIEDNVDAADTLKEVLEIEGHQVDVAYDGAQGIAKARAIRPELVLCDIGLPGMDGYEVARALRADEVLRDVYLVALSGYALPEDQRRAAEAGFDRHIAKPPSLEQLQGLLAEGGPVSASLGRQRP